MTKPWDHGGKTRQQRGYGRLWERVRLQALERDKHLCQPCLAKGIVTPAQEVDHVIPKAKGGTDELGNLSSTCRPCHQVKTLADSGKKAKPATGLDGWPVD